MTHMPRDLTPDPNREVAIWVIFKGLREWPDGFVVRRAWMRGVTVEVDHLSYRAEAIEGARRAIRKATRGETPVRNMGRPAGLDPTICEVWA